MVIALLIIIGIMSIVSVSIFIYQKKLISEAKKEADELQKIVKIKVNEFDALVKENKAHVDRVQRDKQICIERLEKDRDHWKNQCLTIVKKWQMMK